MGEIGYLARLQFMTLSRGPQEGTVCKLTRIKTTRRHGNNIQYSKMFAIVCLSGKNIVILFNPSTCVSCTEIYVRSKT